MCSKFSSAGGLILLFCFSLTGGAQDAPASVNDPPEATPTTSPVHADFRVTGSPVRLTVREGTEVKLKLAQYLSSRLACEGDPVNLILDEDLKVGDAVVATAGAKALATVTRARKSRMLGRAGELSLRLEYLIVRNSRMRLRGTKAKEGEGKEGTAVALTILFGPIGLIKHGKNVEIKEGTPLLAYVDRDFIIPENE